MDFTKHHKPPRLPNYDYSTPGYYFVTFNTRTRGQNILAEIISVGTAALSKVINAVKSLSSKRFGTSLWQRGYYDHIIRNDTDLNERRTYIQNNPLKECESNG